MMWRASLIHHNVHYACSVCSVLGICTYKCTTYEQPALIVSCDLSLNQSTIIVAGSYNCSEWPVGKGTNMSELQYHQLQYT